MADIIAFTADQVAQVTGLSVRRLYYWDREPRFFVPEFTNQHRERYFGRIYSFRDVVSLRTIAILLNNFHVPLQELRRVDPWLKQQHDEPWASLRLYVLGRRVYFKHPDTGQILAARYPHQEVIPFSIGAVVDEVHAVSDRLRERAADEIGQIVRNRYVVHNAPVLAGTRVPTSAVWNFHQAGYTVDQIIREYPRLTPIDVEAAIGFERQRQERQAS
ncbi:MAG: DUF433 domain-containing protein [Chloroflexota bacterium]